MPRLRIVADETNHNEELMLNSPVRSFNANNIGNRFCLQRLVSVVKFIAERGPAFRDDENVGSSRKLFQAKLKKEDAMLLVTDFATVSQIANHCQI